MQWEYLTAQVDREGFYHAGWDADNRVKWVSINELGADRWELVSIQFNDQIHTNPGIAFFKRPKIDSNTITGAVDTGLSRHASTGFVWLGETRAKNE